MDCSNCTNKTCLATKKPCLKIERRLRQEGILPDKWITKHFDMGGVDDLSLKEDILNDLLKGEFNDNLLSQDMRYCLEHMLSVQERQIVELLVEDYSDKRICELMQLSSEALRKSRERAKKKIEIFLQG